MALFVTAGSGFIGGNLVPDRLCAERRKGRQLR